MKKLLTIILSLFITCSYSYTYERANIEITYTIPTDLPKSWNIASKAVESNNQHYTDLIIKCLDKYPIGILKNIKTIYLVSYLSTNNISIGGTEYNQNLYIKVSNDYTLEKRFHHEFSHILFTKYASYFDKTEWLKNSKLEYGKNGVTAIKEGTNSEVNYEYYDKGFLSQYATSEIDEDFASFAENMFFFYHKDDIRSNILLKNKYNLMINFYKAIDSEFSGRIL